MLMLAPAVAPSNPDDPRCHPSSPRRGTVAVYPSDMAKFVEAEWFLHAALGRGVDFLDRIRQFPIPTSKKMADTAPATVAVPGEASSTTTVLDFLGEDITRIVSPVSVCMLLVIVLVSLLSSPDSPSLFSTSFAAATGSSAGGGDDLTTALITAVSFVVAVTAATFLLVLLFYLRCMPCLRAYLGFSALAVLFLLGGQVSLLLLSRLLFPLDAVSFALLPEWTTWLLLVAMAVYDLAGDGDGGGGRVCHFLGCGDGELGVVSCGWAASAIFLDAEIAAKVQRLAQAVARS